MTAALDQRDIQTRRTAAGVRLKADHWASTTVHAWRKHTSDTSLETWCGLDASLEDGARLTTDTVRCLQCAGASWDAFHALFQPRGESRG